MKNDIQASFIFWLSLNPCVFKHYSTMEAITGDGNDTPVPLCSNHFLRQSLDSGGNSLSRSKVPV